MRLWADDVSTPTIAVTSYNGKDSFYFFDENNMESLHLDENKNLLNDKGEIIQKNLTEYYVRNGMDGRNRSKRFGFGSLCHNCTAILDMVSALGSGGCGWACSRVAVVWGRVPMGMFLLGFGCYGACEYVKTYGYGHAHRRFCGGLCD
ncbi:hypothetical protein [Pasteuria penetrans]|uniref:hypothetical protein n=1 Tax=Pasteuria penetrans TaxID=86005 RepID=UPI0011EBDE1D|nr:hypothetical protein [Pasteuria penetrans]